MAKPIDPQFRYSPDVVEAVRREAHRYNTREEVMLHRFFRRYWNLFVFEQLETFGLERNYVLAQSKGEDTK